MVNIEQALKKNNNIEIAKAVNERIIKEIENLNHIKDDIDNYVDRMKKLTLLLTQKLNYKMEVKK